MLGFGKEGWKRVYVYMCVCVRLSCVVRLIAACLRLLSQQKLSNSPPSRSLSLSPVSQQKQVGRKNVPDKLKSCTRPHNAKCVDNYPCCVVNDREKEKEEKKRVGEWNEELSGFELEERLDAHNT